MAGGRKTNAEPRPKKRPLSRSKSRRKPAKIPRQQRVIPPFRLLPNPIKPTKDSAEYRHLVLANNLKVLLISTPEGQNLDPAWTLKFPSFLTNGAIEEEPNCSSKLPSYLPSNFPSLQCGGGNEDVCSRANGPGVRPRSCVSVTIGSGSFADPPQFQGLAHYVEHLLHHGTNAFPGENSFSEFISNCAGYTNAFTDKNVTNYHAVVQSGEETMLELCKRYTSMLTEPLMPLDAVTREIESVDNEYFLRKVGNCFRHNHLLHVATILDQGHPMRKFSIGSKEGLMNPQVANSNSLLKDASHRFVATHYYAENMSIVIQAPEDLDFLQRCVLETFSKIPQKSAFPQEANLGWQALPLPYDVDQFNRMFTAKPSNVDGHTLYLCWALTPQVWKKYKNHVLQYLYAAFGHDAPGGLAHYLRKKGYILSLTIPKEGGFYRNDFATLFEMHFVLTQLGRDSIAKVLEATFSYIKLHQNEGPQKVISNQIKAAAKIQMEKMEMDKSVFQLIRISIQMLHYDPVDVIVGDATPHGTFSSKEINQCLAHFTPDRANYFLFTSDTGTTEYKLESIYGTNYVVHDLPAEMHRRFTNVKVFPEFNLSQPPNPFLNQRSDNQTQEEMITLTETISTSEKVFFNCLPCVPMTSEQLNFIIAAQLGISSREARAHRHVFDVMSVMLKLEIYPRLFHQVDVGFRGEILASSFAGILFFIGSGLCGRSITESFLTMVKGFENFPQNSNEETFKMAKEAVLHNYFSIAAQPIRSVADLSLRLKHSDCLTAIEAHDLLLEMSFATFSEIVKGFKQEICFICQCSGSIRRRDVVHLCTQLENFQCQAITAATAEQIMNPPPLKRIPVGEKCLRMRSLVPEDKVFMVANRYQLAATNPVSDLISRVIYVMIRNKLVFQLRTMEQLGYLVASDFHGDNSGFTVYVCAHLDKHSPCFVDSRIDNFLLEFFENDLTTVKIKQVLDWAGIAHIKPDAVRRVYKQYLVSGSGSEMSKLSVQVVPSRDDGNCLCQEQQNEFPCRSSNWQTPVARIGKARADVCFAAPRDAEDSGTYFITSIDVYHRST